MKKLVKNKVTMKDPVSKALVKEFRTVSQDMPLHELGRVLERHSFVIVDGEYVASSADLLDFMQKVNKGK